MATRRDEGDSDPLPFVQFDRAAMPMVGVLAGCMKVTRQHAIGGLVTFWGMCSEPRVLERLVVEAKAKGMKPRLVLDGETVARRWEMAAEVRLEPVVLAEAGVLEVVENGYRVRGMSRQFGVIERRLQSREAGRKSGEVRRHVVHEPLDTSSPSGSTNVQRPLRKGAKRATPVERPLNGHSTTGEQRSEVRGQRSEDRGGNYVAGETPAADGDAWKRLVADVAAAAPAYAFTGRDFKALKACLTLAKGDAAEVVTRWRRALAADGYPRVRTLAELERTWNHWATAGAANTRSPVAAESVDWDNAQEGEIAL